MNETISLLMSHRSIRKFKNEPVSGELLHTIVGAAQMASTSSNVQAYTVIAVTDMDKRTRIEELAGNQAYITECPVFLVWCADLNRLKHAVEPYLKDKPSYEDSTENFIVATVDASLAAQNAAIAAESLGLGIVYIGGIRNRIAEVADVLSLPELVYPLFGMCVGYPDQEPMLRPRLPLQSVLHINEYDKQRAAEGVKAYDAASSDYLRKRSNGKNAAPWSELMSKRLAEPVRLHMKPFLQDRGFMKQ